MDFGQQIKELRTRTNMNQEEVANRLFVTRQTISNWENNKNLPDLEMLIKISQLFSVSLDELILGEKEMNNMTRKLIDDTSENRRAKDNKVSFLIGAGLMLFGVVLIIIKAFSVEYLDEMGILHENFFLLPIGFLFIFNGILVFVITGIKNLISYFKKKGC